MNPAVEHMQSLVPLVVLLQSNSVTRTLVSNYAAEFNKGHFVECICGHIVAVQPHKFAFLLVVRRINEKVSYTHVVI